MQGPQGIQGPQGPAGISTVTFGFAAPIRLESEVFQLMLDKQLPQGNWAITVTINGVHDPRANNIWLSCELRKGSDGYIGGTSAFETGSAHSMTMNGDSSWGQGGFGVFCRGLVSIRIEGVSYHEGGQLHLMAEGHVACDRGSRLHRRSGPYAGTRYSPLAGIAYSGKTGSMCAWIPSGYRGPGGEGWGGLADTRVGTYSRQGRRDPPHP